MYLIPKQIAFRPVADAANGYHVSVHDAGTDEKIVGDVSVPPSQTPGSDGLLTVEIDPELRTVEGRLVYAQVIALNADGPGAPALSPNYTTEQVLELPGTSNTVIVR